MNGKLIGFKAERELRDFIVKVMMEMRPALVPTMLQPPRIPGGGTGCYKVAVKNDDTYAHGLYERTSCNPDVWELIIPFTEGHCPYSEGDPDGVGCDTTGYEPGSGWTETTASGYDAAWENSSATEAPATPPSGSWEDASYVDGEGLLHLVWRAVDCHWIAYGSVFDPIIE